MTQQERLQRGGATRSYIALLQLLGDLAAYFATAPAGAREELRASCADQIAYHRRLLTLARLVMRSEDKYEADVAVDAGIRDLAAGLPCNQDIPIITRDSQRPRTVPIAVARCTTALAELEALVGYFTADPARRRFLSKAVGLQTRRLAHATVDFHNLLENERDYQFLATLRAAANSIVP